MLFKDELAAQLQYMERYKLLLQNKLTQMPEGRLVSKSEMLIASILTSYNIEFKYEITIRHGYRKLYPDFVIKWPKDGEIFYWEHAGLTKREDYVLDLHARLDGSVDVDYIDKIIRLYLL